MKRADFSCIIIITTINRTDSKSKKMNFSTSISTIMLPIHHSLETTTRKHHHNDCTTLFMRLTSQCIMMYASDAMPVWCTYDDDVIDYSMILFLLFSSSNNHNNNNDGK